MMLADATRWGGVRGIRIRRGVGKMRVDFSEYLCQEIGLEDKLVSNGGCVSGLHPGFYVLHG